MEFNTMSENKKDKKKEELEIVQENKPISEYNINELNQLYVNLSLQKEELMDSLKNINNHLEVVTTTIRLKK